MQVMIFILFFMKVRYWLSENNNFKRVPRLIVEQLFTENAKRAQTHTRHKHTRSTYRQATFMYLHTTSTHHKSTHIDITNAHTYI